MNQELTQTLRDARDYVALMLDSGGDDREQELINRLERAIQRNCLILAAPKLLNELVGILRCFDRDNTLVHLEQRPSGKGIRVFITFTEAQRIRDLIKEAQP